MLVWSIDIEIDVVVTPLVYDPLQTGRVPVVARLVDGEVTVLVFGQEDLLHLSFLRRLIVNSINDLRFIVGEPFAARAHETQLMLSYFLRFR